MEYEQTINLLVSSLIIHSLGSCVVISKLKEGEHKLDWTDLNLVIFLVSTEQYTILSQVQSSML